MASPCGRCHCPPAQVLAGQSSLKILTLIPPKFPILPLKLLHPGFRNEAWLESMPPLGQTLEVVIMTMIDDLKGDGDPMVFNTKNGGGGEGEKKGGVHPSTLVPGGEGVALQIGMLRPCRLGVERVEGGGVLPMPPLHLLGLALPLAPASSQVPEGGIHGEPSGISHSLKYRLIPLFGPPQLFLTCSATARVSVSWSCSTIAWRLGLLSNSDNRGSVRLWGWATPGCVTLTKATGVSKVDQAQFSREAQDTMRVLSGLYTPLCTAESYGIGPLLQQGMSARISHGAKKRVPKRARSNTWIEMDTYGDIH